MTRRGKHRPSVRAIEAVFKAVKQIEDDGKEQPSQEELGRLVGFSRTIVSHALQALAVDERIVLHNHRAIIRKDREKKESE